MTKPCLPFEFGEELQQIFGVELIRRVEIVFDLDKPVSAKLDFLLNEMQVKTLLHLFQDGKWRSPEA